MKLYHIDRFCSLQLGELKIKDGFVFNNNLNQKCLDMVKGYWNNGLSNHGISYFINSQSDNNVMSLSNVMEIVFEYERRLNYDNCISRYESFFAFDKNGVKKFIEEKHLNNTLYKIYEVESDYYEPHNMRVISGNAHYNIAAMAKCYWGNENDPFEREPITEYLMKYPIRIIKEVTISELE